jgi:hypothetical protein
MIVKLIDYLRDRLKTVIRLCYVVLGLLVVFDVVFVDKHSAHLVILSKWYGHIKWFGSNFRIMSPEDFYDD